MDASGIRRLRVEVAETLAQNGYQAIASPLVLGEISLDIDDVFEGPANSLDLAVILARPTSREQGLSHHWQIQRLARALDSATSRRTITVILVGGVSDSRLRSELQTVARVLGVVDSLPVARQLAPLLRLELPALSQSMLDGIAHVKSAISGRYKGELSNLLALTGDGERAVRDAYVSWIDGAFIDSDLGTSRG